MAERFNNNLIDSSGDFIKILMLFFILPVLISNGQYKAFSENAVDSLFSKWYEAKWTCDSSESNPWQMKNIWNAYNTAEVILDYTSATGDTSYLSETIHFLDCINSFHNAKYSGYDDAQWAAITYIKAYRLTGKDEYLSKAEEICNYIESEARNTTSCGGIWWDLEKKHLVTITNELFLMLATMLYIDTKQQSYLSFALEEWEWFKNSGLIAKETSGRQIKYLINDGLTRSCENNNGITWTYNQGVILGGLTNLWKITGDEELLTLAINIADAVIQNLNVKGILKEPVHFPLNTDQQQFKGIFVRYLIYMIQSLPDKYTDKKKEFSEFIMRNSDHVLSHYSNLLFPEYWSNNNEFENKLTSITQTSGIDLIIAAYLVQSAK